LKKISIFERKSPKNMKNRAFIFVLSAAFAVVCIVIFSLLPVGSCQNTSNSSPMKPETFPKDEIALPSPRLVGSMSIEEALHKRRSIRNFQDRSLSLEDASQLLWSAYGVTYVSASGREYKTAPSAGATFPLEIYLLAGKVDGLVAGLYKYNPTSHSLIPVREGDIRSDVSKACLGQKMLAEAPLSLIFSAVYKRTTDRYGKRGEDRYVCMDLGHSAQNVYLQATAMGMGTCAIGAFDDEQLEKLLQFPKEEKILYLMPVGFEKK